MGVSDKLLKQLESPLDKLTEYKDKELPKLQKDTADGKPLPRNLPAKIEELKKIKAIADKLGPALRAISAAIAAIEIGKKIAEAAGDAGKIGGALVLPVAAVGVLQDKIMAKVKEEIAEAKAELPGVFAMKEELLELIKKILIALLALVAANIALNGGKKTGESTSTGGLGKDGGSYGDGAGGSCSLGPQYKTKESCEAAGGTWSSNDPTDILSGMSDLLGQIEQSEQGGANAGDDGGLEKLVRETTAEGTTESVQTSGTGGGSSGGGGGY